MNSFVSVVFNLFTLKQNIYVYINGVCKEVVKAKMTEIDNSIYALCEKYNLNKVYLNGSKNYATKLKQKLETKYEKNNINIIIS